MKRAAFPRVSSRVPTALLSAPQKSDERIISGIIMGKLRLRRNLCAILSFDFYARLRGTRVGRADACVSCSLLRHIRSRRIKG